MRKALGGGVREVHRDEGVALYLDREPLRWSASDRQGLCWSEQLPAGGGSPSTWLEASSDWSACGLAIDGGRRLVHSSVSGISPLYYLDGDEATYFSSRIDALVAAASDPLSVDWEAWAAIFTIAYPLGDSTPFEEIRRLPPAASLEHRESGSSVVVERWPWAQVEPEVGGRMEERIVDALRERTAAVAAERPLRCLLSGGWDSRLLVALADQAGAKPRTFTFNNDVGHAADERLAAGVTEALGIEHEIVPPETVGYWLEWHRSAELQDYQCQMRLQTVRMARRLGDEPGLVVDGLAGDIFIKGLFVSRAMLSAPTWDDTVGRIWKRFRLRGGPPLWARHPQRELNVIARSAFEREASRFAGHPHGATLTIYSTRTRRSISAATVNVLGSRVPVSVPFTFDPVVRAALTADAQSKIDGALYRKVLDLVDERLTRLPSTNDADYDPGPQYYPRLALEREAVRGYADVLGRSPLRPLFSKRLEADLERGKLRPYLRPRLSMHAVDAICRFTIWHERYGAKLRPLDLGGLERSG